MNKFCDMDPISKVTGRQTNVKKRLPYTISPEGREGMDREET